MKSNRDMLGRLCIAPTATIMDAITVISKAEKKVALVVDEGLRLLGTVTDYDVRKGILDHRSFDDPVSSIMVTTPITVKDGSTTGDMFEVIKGSRVAQLPVVDDSGRLTDIHFVDEYFHLIDPHERRVGVIMAGGYGMRLRPVTEHTPKPMLKVAGRPILFILLDQLISEGVDDVYVTLNYMGDVIASAIDHVARYRGRVHPVFEDEVLGTAGSLSLLPLRPTAPFVVLNADLVTNVSISEMFRYHVVERNIATIAMKREVHTIDYGVADLEGSKVSRIREKPSTTYFLNTGVYILDPTVLDFVTSGQQVDMPDIINRLIDDGQRVGSFPVHEYWIDIGDHDQYARAQNDFAAAFESEDK